MKIRHFVCYNLIFIHFLVCLHTKIQIFLNCWSRNLDTHFFPLESEFIEWASLFWNNFVLFHVARTTLCFFSAILIYALYQFKSKPLLRCFCNFSFNISLKKEGGVGFYVTSKRMEIVFFFLLLLLKPVYIHNYQLLCLFVYN